jgi:hypothetical protein
MKLVRFQVLTAASMKIRAFWDVAPCSLRVDRRFRGAYCLCHQGDECLMALIMETVCTSETSVCTNETTQHHIFQETCSPREFHQTALPPNVEILHVAGTAVL